MTIHCIVHVFRPVWDCAHASVFQCISVEKTIFETLVCTLYGYLFMFGESAQGLGNFLQNGDSFKLKIRNTIAISKW